MPMGSSPAHPFNSHQYVFAAKSWVSILSGTYIVLKSQLCVILSTFDF